MRVVVRRYFGPDGTAVTEILHVLGGLVVSVLGPRFAGPNPAGGDGFLRARKVQILKYAIY